MKRRTLSLLVGLGLLCLNTPAALAESIVPGSLKISAFKDITAYILESAQQQGSIITAIKYVKNADEAHSDLTSGAADIVFMSYDDTLSMALQDKNSDVVAIMPIHGAILDLCGSLHTKGETKIGIDTDTGYARALRYYLKHNYPPEQYAHIEWIKAGATNLRVQKLLSGSIDATLLNPPYSYATGVSRITRMYDAIGSYQGVVGNVRRSWLSIPGNRVRLILFMAAYYQRVQEMQNNEDATVAAISKYYSVSRDVAAQSYDRLWQQDGLAVQSDFDSDKLVGTERIFAADTGLAIPATRTWLMSL